MTWSSRFCVWTCEQIGPVEDSTVGKTWICRNAYLGRGGGGGRIEQ